MREAILNNIFTELSTLNYNVERANFFGQNQSQPINLVIAQGRTEGDNSRFNEYISTIRVDIFVTFKQLDSDQMNEAGFITNLNSGDISTDTIYNTIASAVFGKMLEDRSRGGHAINTVYVADTPARTDDNNPSYTMSFDVEYKHRFDSL